MSNEPMSKEKLQWITRAGNVATKTDTLTLSFKQCKEVYKGISDKLNPGELHAIDSLLVASNDLRKEVQAMLPEIMMILDSAGIVESKGAVMADVTPIEEKADKHLKEVGAFDYCNEDHAAPAWPEFDLFHEHVKKSFAKAEGNAPTPIDFSKLLASLPMPVA